MAFTGLMVSCHFVGSVAFDDDFAVTPGVMSKAVWSESPASDTATTNVAPAIEKGANKGKVGQPVFRIRAAADSYVSIAAVPDASASPRHFIPANTFVDLLVIPGDKLEWIAVP